MPLMSTELKARSKAYNLTRVGLRGIGNVGVIVGTRHFDSTLSIPEIEQAFRADNWDIIQHFDLLEETVERLKLDLAQFALTKGHGMEAY
jgi:hypothetical protein